MVKVQNAKTISQTPDQTEQTPHLVGGWRQQGYSAAYPNSPSLNRGCFYIRT